ncbi:hypothetical protein SELSPUOL_02683 [Selenomonas sputigena ATCC 35185]|uniref:Uncharacterized protein n=1 Tax=Selenomonas sputigena (strain ATCC 35185 / DSM 20758 / CCUG 44933 / VPI D19B-28) TaxID=546271 RepID=C9LYX3_SELS3|nr:hypothetical protein SELSPUOL_02683 [Selenomonas sputigena ATCC 35185]
MRIGMAEKEQARSRPTRARGLKFSARNCYSRRDDVAPHAGAWIEILRERF